MSVLVTDAHTGAVLHVEPVPPDPAVVLRQTQARLTETMAALVMAESTLRDLAGVLLEGDSVPPAWAARAALAALRQIGQVRRG